MKMKTIIFAALASICATALARAQPADDAAGRLIRSRAVEAMIWGMPAVNTDLMLQEALKFGAKPNDIVFWSRPANAQNQTLTPNPDSIYFMSFWNVKDEPIVIDVPPAQGGSFAGNIVNIWQMPLEDAGPQGADKGTRTSAAKANILVNSPNETKYFYQDLDVSGARLNGANRYTVTFAKDQTPPVNGFWSLTLYNEHHFFAPNEINRYSTGTKNKALKYNPDGSLTINVQADAPPAAQRDNWLPSPKGADFTLYIRAYWPKAPVTDGTWTPPAVQKAS